MANMVRHKLQNIVFDEVEGRMSCPELFYRMTEKPAEDEHPRDNTYSYSFDTYMNALAPKLWKSYTHAQSFNLHLSIRGTVTWHIIGITQPGNDPAHIERQELASGSFAGTQTYAEADIGIPPSNADLIALEIDCLGNVDFGPCYFYTLVEEECVRPVDLQLISTTFKREDYVYRNAQVFADSLTQCDDPIAGCAHMLYVDNGQTLNKDQLGSLGMECVSNPNAGGAGGFARGMIEAQAKTYPPTHVLLMDDDVILIPEAIKRTFNLLALIRDEWAQAFIGGSMLEMEKPWAFVSDLVTLTQASMMPARGPFDLRELSDVLACVRQPDMTNACALGWWYCCMPVTTLEEHGLPLPLFISYDDVEYSLRINAPKILLNGICVPHTWGGRTSEGRHAYYAPRNRLILDSTTLNCSLRDSAAPRLLEWIRLDIKAYRYETAALRLQALEDFLAGPQTLEQSAHTFETEQLVALQDLGLDASLCSAKIASLPDEPFKDQSGPIIRRLCSLSWNKQLIGSDVGSSHEANEPVIPYRRESFGYPFHLIFGSQSYFAVDIQAQLAVHRVRNRVRARALIKQYYACAAKLFLGWHRISKLWQDTHKQLRTKEFWKAYLKRLASRDETHYGG